jgi:hypothetical protein
MLTEKQDSVDAFLHVTFYEDVAVFFTKNTGVQRNSFTFILTVNGMMKGG